MLVLGAYWSRLFWEKSSGNKEELNKLGRQLRNGPKKQHAWGIKEKKTKEKKSQRRKWLDRRPTVHMRLICGKFNTLGLGFW
jgi:hypothetical protein